MQYLNDLISSNKKFKAVAVANKSANLIASISNMISSRLQLGSVQTINTPSLSVGIGKTSAQNISDGMSLTNGKFSLPSFCSMMNQKVAQKNTSANPLDLTYDPKEKNDCMNKPITSHVNLNFLKISMRTHAIINV